MLQLDSEMIALSPAVGPVEEITRDATDPRSPREFAIEAANRTLFAGKRISRRDIEKLVSRIPPPESSPLQDVPIVYIGLDRNDYVRYVEMIVKDEDRVPKVAR